MLTNILMSIIVTVITNTYHPKQYCVTHYYSTYPPTVEGVWQDSEPMFYFEGNRERENLDKKIEEVREITTIQFSFMDKQYNIDHENKILSQKIYNKQVTETWTEDTNER